VEDRQAPRFSVVNGFPVGTLVGSAFPEASGPATGFDFSEFGLLWKYPFFETAGFPVSVFPGLVGRFL